MSEKRAGEVTIEGAKILWRNFAGVEKTFNAAGDRNFNVVLPEDLAKDMIEDGWNVKYKEPRDGEGEGIYVLHVAVSFKGRPPRIVMVTSKGRTSLTEDEIELLDWVDIKNVDLIIRPYHWEMQGKSGVKAYLKSIYVTILEDYLELKYSEVPELGPGSAPALDGGQSPLELNRGSEEFDSTYDIVDAEIVEDGD